jgi:hypothetical protein
MLSLALLPILNLLAQHEERTRLLVPYSVLRTLAALARCRYPDHVTVMTTAAAAAMATTRQQPRGDSDEDDRDGDDDYVTTTATTTAK